FESKKLLPYNPERLTMQCFSDENEYLSIEKAVLLDLKNSFLAGELASTLNIFSDNFTVNNFMSGKKEVRDINSISYERSQPLPRLLNKSKALGHMNKFLADFKDVNFAEIVGTKYISLPGQRAEKQRMKTARIEARFDIRGTNENSKIQKRGIFNINVTKVNNEWKIDRITLTDTETLKTSETFFKNMTAESKVASNVPSHLRREAIRRGGYAMALGDYNNDKEVDLYVATVAESVLMKGEGKGESFKVVKNETLDNQSLVKAAAFADFSNKGHDDLLVVRFAPNEAQTKNDRSDILIYRNKDGKLHTEKGLVKFDQKTNYAMPLALADFNNDGFLDFYVGFPGAKDFTTLEEAKQEEGLATQGIFFNNGRGVFKDNPYKGFAKFHKEMISKNGVDDDLSRIFPHSAIAVDFDENGTSDLVVIDDRANLSPIYMNNGKADFVYATKKIGIGLMDYGMGAEIMDINNDGKYDFLMSSVNFNASKRIKDSCEINWSVQDTISAGVKGLRSFTANKNKTFTETTEQNGLEWIGQGAGGVKVVDYNNDGLEDIYVANGLWTGSENDQSQDIASKFVMANTMGIVEDGLKSGLRTDQIVYEKPKRNNEFQSLLFRSDSQSAIMDILSFYRGDVDTYEKSQKAPSLAGAQRNRLFHNNGDGTFTEVGYLLGLDSIADGYMVATTDLDKDGFMDIVLRNADPGFKKDQFAPVEIFKNLGKTNKKSVVLSLRGTTSNRNAVGALISAEVGDKLHKRQLVGNSGTVQSERIIHIGLDDNKVLNKLTIRWPSGEKQVVKNMKPGFYELKEPISGLQASK
ncbi:CRTAC1 family protein, partial [Bacteriovorax sp. DB6_IX]|uniref:CRTAC1 family protein n=1 Tax=Bacteriovorax sp. DB6_IX TaxID=1353530 RepID=UPI000553CE6A